MKSLKNLLIAKYLKLFGHTVSTLVVLLNINPEGKLFEVYSIAPIFMENERLVAPDGKSAISKLAASWLRELTPLYESTQEALVTAPTAPSGTFDITTVALDKLLILARFFDRSELALNAVAISA